MCCQLHATTALLRGNSLSTHCITRKWEGSKICFIWCSLGGGFWIVTPCILIEFYWRFGGTYNFHPKSRAVIQSFWLLVIYVTLFFDPEDRSTVFYRNVDQLLWFYGPSHFGQNCLLIKYTFFQISKAGKYFPCNRNMYFLILKFYVLLSSEFFSLSNEGKILDVTPELLSVRICVQPIITFEKIARYKYYTTGGYSTSVLFNSLSLVSTWRQSVTSWYENIIDVISCRALKFDEITYLTKIATNFCWSYTSISVQRKTNNVVTWNVGFLFSV
jgi:hypothetical protein